METILLLYCTTSLFFLYGLSVHLVPLIKYGFEKSFTVKIVSKENILKTWFFLLFILAFFYTKHLIKSGDKFEIMSFTIKASNMKTLGAVLGFIIMLILYIIPKKIVKNKSFIVESLRTDLKSVHEAILSDNSVTNDYTTINTIAHIKNEDDKDQDYCENFKINALDKSDNLKINYSSSKTCKDVIKPILRKNSPVIPDNNADDVILKKFNDLKAVHGSYCNFEDFRNLLSNIKIEKKILFTDKYGSPIKSKKVEFLRILNDVLDGNIENHPNNLKVEQWIYDSFDNDNFEGEKITGLDISRSKSC